MITGKTKLLGVIGHPVEHSLSPAMHNAAIAHLKLDYVYLPLPVVPENLATALAGFAAIDLQGFSVTIPHKQKIIPLLSETSAIAQAVGAVNTVWRNEELWCGTNTDVEGFLAPLKSLNRDWSRCVVSVLGNGGAARAVVAACIELGCAVIRVVGRDLQKLQQFHASWNNQVRDRLQVATWEKLSQIVPDTTLLINTTPIGMYPHIDVSPLTTSEISRLSADAIVYDLIYTPRPTLLLLHAEKHGALTIDGSEMLVQQGAAALKIWLQQPVPVEIMRQALQQQLNQGEKIQAGRS